MDNNQANEDINKNENGILTDFPHDKARELCEAAAREYGMEIFTLKVLSFCMKGDNYMGIVCKIHATGKLAGRDKTLSMVIKTAPVTDEVRMITSSANSFSNEIQAYTELLPAYDRLQIELNVSKSKRFVYPKCYGATQELYNETIVLEDMSTKGFVMLDRLASLSFDHVALTLKEIAKLHALSYSLRDKEPEVYEKHVLSMSSRNLFAMMKDSVEFFMYFRQVYTRAEQSVDAESRQWLQAQYEAVAADIVAVARTEWTDRYSVICHGDCWTNNLLFRHEDGIPVETVLLDYQIIRHTSPATDILYLLLTSTDQTLRREHLTSCLDIYHDTLSEALHLLDMDVEEVLPRTQLDKEIRSCARFGLGMAILTLPLFTCSSDDAPDFNKAPIIDALDGKESSLYTSRMSGLVKDIIEYNWVEEV